MAIMASKYAGKCKRCQARYAVGDMIFWSPRATGALCLACRPDVTPNTPKPTYNPPTTRKRAPGRKRTEPTAPGTERTVREFGSWAQFIDYAEEHKNPAESSHHYYGATKEWYGSKSYDDAVKMARQGWTDIRPEVDALVEKIEHVIAPALQPAFQSYFDVSGGMVDVGRFLDGEPECMVETRLVNVAKPGRVISILIDGFYSASIDPESIKARGAAIIGLVDSLERMQHGTEIWYETSFRGNPLTYLVKLKSAEDVLDIDTLMFAIAHPSAYRRINFAAQERRGENRKFQVGEGNSYGGPDGLHMGERVGASLELPRLKYGDETADGTVWIQKVLSDFGLVRKEGE